MTNENRWFQVKIWMAEAEAEAKKKSIPLCKTCKCEPIYDGLPAWYCECCGSVYDDDFNLVRHRWNGIEYETPVSPDGDD